MSQKELIHQGAEKLRELHEKIETLFSDYKRSRSASDLEAWKKATFEYHARYEMLAFPGGLSRIFDGLTSADPAALENAITFLEADPRFFRSGYMKTDIIKILKKLRFSPEQRTRLQAVVLARVNATETPREFRAYCQLAKAIVDADFKSVIISIAESGGVAPKRHAKWILAYLNGARIERSYFPHSSG